MALKFRKRNKDGTLGDYIAPFDESMPSELLTALEAIAMLDMQNAELSSTVQAQQKMLDDYKKAIEDMKAEIAAMKGGDGA